jgi:hypothetical protein
MTISTTTSRLQYATDGVTVAFAISFPFFDDADINAISVDAAAVETVLVLTTDFTVSGGDGATGTLTTVATLATGGTLTIYRATPQTQASHYVEDDPLPASTLEADLDRAAMRDQELQDESDRSLVFSPSVPAGVSAILPTPAASELLGWNAAADRLENRVVQNATSIVSATEADVLAATSAALMANPLALRRLVIASRLAESNLAT